MTSRFAERDGTKISGFYRYKSADAEIQQLGKRLEFECEVLAISASLRHSRLWSSSIGAYAGGRSPQDLTVDVGVEIDNAWKLHRMITDLLDFLYRTSRAPSRQTTIRRIGFLLPLSLFRQLASPRLDKTTTHLLQPDFPSSQSGLELIVTKGYVEQHPLQQPGLRIVWPSKATTPTRRSSQTRETQVICIRMVGRC